MNIINLYSLGNEEIFTESFYTKFNARNKYIGNYKIEF